MAHDGPHYTLENYRQAGGTFSWYGQALQYDQIGPPGEFVYQRYADGPQDQWVDCLLYYNPDDTQPSYRMLVGILNHYPQGAINGLGRILEPVGSCNVFVHPQVDQKPMVDLLWKEAKRRWNPPDDVGPIELTHADVKLRVGRVRQGKLATTEDFEDQALGEQMQRFSQQLSPSEMDGNRRVGRP